MSHYGEVRTLLTGIQDNTSYGFRFGGEVYHNYSGGNDNASRFETNTLLVRDFTVTGRTESMNLGDSSNQSYVLGNGSSWSGTKLDLSSLWFRNSSTTTNGYLSILATK